MLDMSDLAVQLPEEVGESQEDESKDNESQENDTLEDDTQEQSEDVTRSGTPPSQGEVGASETGGNLSIEGINATGCETPSPPESGGQGSPESGIGSSVEESIMTGRTGKSGNRNLLWDSIGQSDKRVRYYTGLPGVAVFLWLLSFFANFEFTHYSGRNVLMLSREDQLLLTLMKLRLNVEHQLLCDWFQISVGTVTNIFRTWLSALHIVLLEGMMARVPPLHVNQNSLPTVFIGYEHCRMVVDCSEVTTAIPNSMRLHNLMFSNYKHRTTLKGLIGIAPNGTITFMSKLFPGSTSDKVIVKESGVLDVFQPGDLILADKGFLISDLLPEGVTVNTPPFLLTPQFTPEQVEETTDVAQSRIHVERAILRVKDFGILSYISERTIGVCSQIFQVCGALANFKNPLIAEVKESMSSTFHKSDGYLSNDGLQDAFEDVDFLMGNVGNLFSDDDNVL